MQTLVWVIGLGLQTLVWVMRVGLADPGLGHEGSCVQASRASSRRLAPSDVASCIQNVRKKGFRSKTSQDDLDQVAFIVQDSMDQAPQQHP